MTFFCISGSCGDDRIHINVDLNSPARDLLPSRLCKLLKAQGVGYLFTPCCASVSSLVVVYIEARVGTLTFQEVIPESGLTDAPETF